MDVVQVREIGLSYRQSGQGPDVVLVHGVAGNMAGWYLCGLVSELSRCFRVTTYDLRGHGYSESSPSGYTSKDMAKDLHGLIEQLGLDDVAILGHSFGAAIGMHLAVLHPEVVRGLVLSDVFLPGLADVQGAPAEWPGWQSYKSHAARLGLDIGDDWTDLEVLFEQVAKMSASEQSALAQTMGKFAVERLIGVSETTCGEDVGRVAGLTGERILQVTHPVVCLNGDRSPFRPLARYLAEHLPNCSVTLVPEAEHFAFEENPAEFVRLATRELALMCGIQESPAAVADQSAARRTDTMMTPKNPS